MKNLELIIKKLKFFRKNNYQDLFISNWNKSNLIYWLTTNPIIKDYIGNLVQKTDNYSKAKKFVIVKNSLPLCVLYNEFNLKAGAIAVGEKPNLDTFLWNRDCLDATLKVLKVILKEHKEQTINNPQL